MFNVLIALTLATPAFADDYASAAVDRAQASEEIGRLAAQQLQAEARLAALEAERAAAKKPAAKAKAPAPKPTAEAAAQPVPAPAAPPQQIEVTPIPAPAPAPVMDPELEAAKAELEAAKRAYDAAVAGMAAMKAPVVNVAAPVVELHPVVLRTEHTVVNVRTSGFHPSVYTIPSALIGKPLPGSDDAIGVRLDIGTRLVWDVSENTVVGLSVEGGPGMGGWSVRAMPTLVGYNARDTGWGVLVGAGYNCDGLTDAGCMAERTGGLAAGTWEHGWGAFNLSARLGAEVNYVTTPDASGAEFRVFTGVGGALGKARSDTVTVQ